MKLQCYFVEPIIIFMRFIHYKIFDFKINWHRTICTGIDVSILNTFRLSGTTLHINWMRYLSFFRVLAITAYVHLPTSEIEVPQNLQTFVPRNLKLPHYSFHHLKHFYHTWILEEFHYAHQSSNSVIWFYPPYDIVLLLGHIFIYRWPNKSE